MSHERVRRIEAAIDLDSLRQISALDLLDFDVGRKVRQQADERKDTDRAIVCQKCEGPVIVPMHWRTREYYFRHFHRDAQCPWTNDEATLSVDDASARIFQGQQEGELHRRLKETLGKLIGALPDVTDCVVDQNYVNAIGKYRKPDVRFTIHGKTFVIEIQLATTQRPIITERNKFYIAEGIEIIWVTWNPIPAALADHKASFIDIITDHNDNLFSVDEETIRATQQSSELKFRVHWWDGVNSYQKIIGLTELVLREGKLPFAVDRPRQWHDRQKDAWQELGLGRVITDEDCKRLWAELSDHLRESGLQVEDSIDWNVVSLISLLISLERGMPINSRQKNVTEMLHTFLTTSDRKPMARIVEFAIKATHNGALLDRLKTKQFLSLAIEQPQVPKSSVAAKIVRQLFPEWANH